MPVGQTLAGPVTLLAAAGFAIPGPAEPSPVGNAPWLA
jgi:hypothetical protein